MDQRISEAAPLASRNSNRRMEKALAKVDGKAEQLRTMGLTISDQELLQNRLNFVWGEPKPDDMGTSQTAWRKTRARRAYSKIQEADDHLFLAVVLAVSPTECAQKAFDSVIEHLLRLNNYEQYRLSLSATAKSFFESTAAEQGFSGSRRYLNFMQTLFPQKDERRIQLAYSDIPLQSVEKLFHIMRKGVETSQQWLSERERGQESSGFVTALIPTGDKDCCFTVTVGREDMMRGVRQLGLTQFKL